MVNEIVLVVIAVIAFIACYLSKRRFSLLILGASAGYLLAELLAPDLALLFSYFRLDEANSLILAKILLIIVPVVIIAVQKLKSKNKLVKLAGSLLFSLFILAVIISSVGKDIEFSYFKEIGSFLLDNNYLAIVLGILLALADFLTIDMSALKKK